MTHTFTLSFLVMVRPSKRRTLVLRFESRPERTEEWCASG
jgi:hypothetical protein